MLRRHVPLIMGTSVVILLIDAAIVFFRALGMDKGTAIYVALVAALIVGAVAIRWSWQHAPAQRDSADQDERTG